MLGEGEAIGWGGGRIRFNKNPGIQGDLRREGKKVGRAWGGAKKKNTE